MSDSEYAAPPCSALVADVCEPKDAWRIEGLPFSCGKGRKPGVYAFFAYDGPKEVCLYVGKAFCLRNRLQQHVDHSEWLNRFWAETERDDAPLLFPLFARVWFTDDRAGMETRITDALRPRYNQRHE
jgi:hypothetical protein